MSPFKKNILIIKLNVFTIYNSWKTRYLCGFEKLQRLKCRIIKVVEPHKKCVQFGMIIIRINFFDNLII